MKKTIILMWNPYFNSYKMEQFEDELHHLHLGMTTDYNWSIHEHNKVEDGDRIYMVRCGQGRTGIVMSGTLVGEPYGGEDWAGRDLPLHHTQREIGQGEDYTDFELMLRPTADFFTPLLSRGRFIKVLEPEWVAEDVAWAHREAARLYD